MLWRFDGRDFLQVKRIHPLVLIAIFVVILVGGLFWKITSAQQCMDRGDTVVAPMTRGQNCADISSNKKLR
ncbi:MAG: hypothetical protein ACI9TB_001290 [Parasphingorhabdus sp.]|jgi:hypothetical protein